MSSRHIKESSTISLVEAVEMLSNIADLDFDRELGISQRHDVVVRNKKITYRTVHWLHHQDADASVKLVKETFRIILNYLRNFYRKEFGYITNQQAIEGIKTIMVLVGEAARKLDKYTSLFHKVHSTSVTETKEYKKLQEFYLSRIARKIDEGLLGKWILALSSKIRERRVPKLEGRKSSQTKHVFIDLESAKRDTEYELFFMRKEDGTRFFSPRLIRNIKLVSDFGDYFGEFKGDDPIRGLEIWHDRFMHACAKNILKIGRPQIDQFYREALPFKDREFVQALNKTIIALMLGSNPHNLMHNSPIKSCLDYFKDFQYFLREALLSDDYHKLITYPPKKSSKFAHSLLDLTHTLCAIFCSQLEGYHDQLSMLQGLLKEAYQTHAPEVKREGLSISKRLSEDYAAMSKLLRMHPSGSMNIILDALEGGNYQSFDPLVQGNIPQQLYSLQVKDRHCSVIRLPSPTNQEFIHKVSVTNEFKGFLRSCVKDHTVSKFLLINLQDRTSWKEHFRCTAIEDLANNEAFSRQLDVVNLAKDTEFFHQLAPYHQDNHAEVFIKHFKEHLTDEKCGFVFSEPVQKELFSHFIDGVIEGIHRVFFSGRNTLLREHRMDFIELFYLFLQLKLIEIVKPNLLSFSCKDGIDIGGSSAIQLYIFLKILNQQILSEGDHDKIDWMIYGPSIMIRERVMLPERFNRMLSAIKNIETTRDQLGFKDFAKTIQHTFGKYYRTPILQAKVT